MRPKRLEERAAVFSSGYFASSSTHRLPNMDTERRKVSRLKQWAKFEHSIGRRDPKSQRFDQHTFLVPAVAIRCTNMERDRLMM